jgi:hypothetical protein
MGNDSKKYSISGNPDGFSIWLNGRWILDASCFLKDGEIDINSRYFNIYRNDYQKGLRLKARGWKKNPTDEKTTD